MLTKSDLAAIQKMFDISKKGTDEKFAGIDKRFEEMDKKFTSKFDFLLDRIDKNTGELVELITSGFNSYEERFRRLEKEVFKSN